MTSIIPENDKAASHNHSSVQSTWVRKRAQSDACKSSFSLTDKRKDTWVDERHLSRNSCKVSVTKVQKRRRSSIRDVLKLTDRFGQSHVWCTLQQVITIVSLFAYDFTRAFLPMRMDITTEVILTICFALFTIDIFLQMGNNLRNVKTLQFWFDVLGTISMISDLMWLQNSFGINMESLTISKSARLVRMNARLAKLMKTTRITRLWRILKGYVKAPNTSTPKNIVTTSYGNVEINIARNPGSLGGMTANRLSIRVVCFIVFITTFFPLLDAPPYIDVASYNNYLQMFEIASDPGPLISAFTSFHNSAYSITIKNDILFSREIPSIRDSENIAFETVNGSSLKMDVSKMKRTEHAFDMIKFFALISILLYLCAQTSSDTQRLVTQPLECLTQMLTKLTHSLVVLGGDPEMSQKLVKSGYLTRIIEEQVQTIWDKVANKKTEEKVKIEEKNKVRQTLVLHLKIKKPLDEVLDCPIGSEYFRLWCVSNFMYESFAFVTRVIHFTRQFAYRGNQIMADHIVSGSKGEVNISFTQRDAILNTYLEYSDFNPFMFEDAANEVYGLLDSQGTKRFWNSLYYTDYLKRLETLDNGKKKTEMSKEEEEILKVYNCHSLSLSSKLSQDARRDALK